MTFSCADEMHYIFHCGCRYQSVNTSRTCHGTGKWGRHAFTVQVFFCTNNFNELFNPGIELSDQAGILGDLLIFSPQNKYSPV